MIEPSSTVAELVVEHPSYARVFERVGIDYCCGGGATLAEACAKRGLDPATLALFLEVEPDESESEERDWTQEPLADLCIHIVELHHRRARRELPRLQSLCEKVVRAHGAEQPELVEVQEVLDGLAEEMQRHMDDEEAHVLPALVAGGVPGPDALADLEDEHVETGAALRRLRDLTGDYALERARCNTHRALLHGLAELEAEVHWHVHEENHVLFPRARALA